MPLITLKRLARDLQIRRRRLDVFQRSESWPGKDIAWRMERAGYDHLLVLAADMLEVEAPELAPRCTLEREERVALEDRLAVAGLNVFAYWEDSTPNDFGLDGDLFF